MARSRASVAEAIRERLRDPRFREALARRQRGAYLEVRPVHERREGGVGRPRARAD